MVYGLLIASFPLILNGLPWPLGRLPFVCHLSMRIEILFCQSGAFLALLRAREPSSTQSKKKKKKKPTRLPRQRFCKLQR
ncbi:MAG: hypothetical protein J3Q66DRAFT_359539 [Benniella sp.]|nr:MAG: hypothetical protein J3Q66DRAFT_359539 [Benniella sp.]